MMKIRKIREIREKKKEEIRRKLIKTRRKEAKRRNKQGYGWVRNRIRVQLKKIVRIRVKINYKNKKIYKYKKPHLY